MVRRPIQLALTDLTWYGESGMTFGQPLPAPLVTRTDMARLASRISRSDLIGKQVVDLSDRFL